jgi:anti-sigma factor RsiW
MNCDDFRELMSEKVAGELSLEQAKEFDAHQQVCSTCKDTVREWQQLENLLRASWPSEDPPFPFFLPVPKAHAGWLGTVRNWASVASMAIVAATFLFLVLSRPTIQYGQHALSINFGRSTSQAGSAPAQAVSRAEVQAWVQAAVQQSKAEESSELQPASQGKSELSREEESRQLARMGAELEMVKETQVSLWQQVQQHGLYMQSAWSRPAEQIRPGQDAGASRQ